MDIASRIKIFMDYLGIPSSQFADTCGIPRPSLSQLLNGRNKKVSDEVIGKIHDAYPSLSVLWLMFGEGSMVPDANNEISEPENDLFSASQAAESNDNEEFALDSDFVQSEVLQMPEKIDESANSIKRPIRKENNVADTVQPAPQASMSLNFDNTKKIVNIMVFYNDNSFEWFVPKS